MARRVPTTTIAAASTAPVNFEYLPELHYRWAYPALLGVMAGVVIGMLVYFRRRGWLGNAEEEDEEY